MDKPAQTEYPIHELLHRRWSPRAFSERPVELEKVRSLLEAARWAPSSFNEQPWIFFVATRDEHRQEWQRLRACLVEFNRQWAGKAPVMMLVAAKKHFEMNGRANLHAYHDVGLALGNLTVQATALDLSLHMLAGFDAEQARREFQIPTDHDPVVMLAVGYRGPAEGLPDPLREKELAPRTRKPFSQFVFTGSWGQPAALIDTPGQNGSASGNG